MRAQFATVEALLAVTAILSAASFMSASMSEDRSAMYFERSRLVQSAAVYDLSNYLARNRSANDCLAHSDAACANAIVGNYESVFGIENISVATSGFAAGAYASRGVLDCFPFRFLSTNESDAVCISAG
ncbi:Uncharacterised protein [uncultured archaeon]|nr:Uncharacterised protein [uncultured archaeon]